MTDFYKKYLKYKSKYLELKKLKNQLPIRSIYSENNKENISNQANLAKSTTKQDSPTRSFGTLIEKRVNQAKPLNPIVFPESKMSSQESKTTSNQSVLLPVSDETDINLDHYIEVFFKTYNLITWDNDKLYVLSGSNTELIEFCKNLDKTDERVTVCSPPYPKQTPETRSKECCSISSIRGTKIVPKLYSRKFEIGSRIKTGQINFEFEGFYPQITTRNIREEARDSRTKFIRNQILENYPTLSPAKKDRIYEVLIDNDVEPDLPPNKFTDELVVHTIGDEDFYGLDEIIEIVFENEEYKTNPEYINLQRIIDGVSQTQTHSIQQYDNKLFKEVSSNTYYFYFSYGTLNMIEFVNWSESLRVYVEKIRELTQYPENKIVLAGHSVGSITIQHLAIELIKSRIDINNVYVIGSGCRMSVVLNDEELELFKSAYTSRYFFVLNGLLKNGIIQYDHRSIDRRNVVNKINTHFLVCDGPVTINEKINCVSTQLEILDHDHINTSGEFIPNSDATLHDFATYSFFYLK